MHEVLATGGSKGSSSPIALLLIGIFFIVVSAVGAANPRLIWRMSRWQYKNPDANEPSDKAFAVRRAFSCVFIVIGIVMVVLAITKF